MFSAFIQGFGISAGLIIAIGAQNAFVLSQGIKRQHHLWVAAICILCDATLTTIGVAGVGAFLARSELLSLIITWVGVAFLFLYGLRAFISAWRGEKLKADAGKTMSLRAAILFTLGVTLLNPHVYLDTVILMGSIGARLEESLRAWFVVGAVAASFTWFLSLSLGGRMLAPLFEKPIAWRILDTAIGLIMWAIALSLAFS